MSAITAPIPLPVPIDSGRGALLFRWNLALAALHGLSSWQCWR